MDMQGSEITQVVVSIGNARDRMQSPYRKYSVSHHLHIEMYKHIF